MSACHFVLLHGFLGSPKAFDALLLELKARPSLGAFTVQCLTLTGHEGRAGTETGPAPQAETHAFEQEISRLLAAIAPPDPAQPVHLLGYSLGGRLALGMALREPHRFASLWLVGAQPGLRTQEERQLRRDADAAWTALLRSPGSPQEVLEQFLKRWEAQPLFETQRALDPALLEPERSLRLKHDPSALAHALGQLGLGHMPSYWERLPEMSLPVVLVVGEKDLKFSALAQEAAALLPRARVLAAPGAGHNVLLERPQWLAAELARALDSASHAP